MGAHLPDVEFGFESMRRVDVQSKGAINDGRPDRSGCRTPPPAPPAATRVTRLRGPKWPSFGACSLSHLQSSTQGAAQNRRTSAETALDPSAGSICVVRDRRRHRQKPTAVTKEPNIEACEIDSNFVTL